MTQGKALTEKRLANWFGPATILEREHSNPLSGFPQIVRDCPYLLWNCGKGNLCLAGEHKKHNIFVRCQRVERLQGIQDSVERNASCFVLPFVGGYFCHHSRNIREPGGKGLCRNCSVGLSRVSIQE